MDFKKIKEFVKNKNVQSHLCICNTDLIEETIANGIYGFPHSGTSRKKSFWRSIASMYNIGINDLIFLYRTSGKSVGCQEIYGPFRIYDIEGQPSTFYDSDSVDFPMKVKGDADCKVRFLFTNFEDDIYSMKNNYELIKKYESREIWGYRHPAVMNIGAARKKSVAAFTNKQTLKFIDLFEKFGIRRKILKSEIPSFDRIKFYNDFKPTTHRFKIDSNFISNNYSNDEAFLYSYFISALKNNKNYYSSELVDEFSKINSLLLKREHIAFVDLTNIMLEVIITTHLQHELDIVLTDKEDKIILFFEFKVGELTQHDIDQTEDYLDLLNAIYPTKKSYANLIGSGKDPSISIRKRFNQNIRLVKYEVSRKKTTKLNFVDITN